MPEEMDHNEFNFYEDLVKPFQEFISNIEELSKVENGV